MLLRILFGILLSFLFFVFIVLTVSHPNPIGAAIQQWLPVGWIVFVPFLFNYNLGRRIGLSSMLLIPAIILGMSWTGYSDLGDFVFIGNGFVILIIISIGHYLLSYLEKINPISSLLITITLIILVSLYSIKPINDGLDKWNQVIKQFNTKCQTVGSIYGHCDDAGYMRFFPPNNHITF
jgi:hypothetical protein